MRIGFMGTHSTGKTATAEKLATYGDFVFVPSSARRVAASGGKVNRQADRESQILTTLARAVDLEKAYQDSPGKIILSDRTPLDSLAYTKYQADYIWDSDDLSDFYWTYSSKFVYQAMRSFDRLFFFSAASLSLIEDGLREKDDLYRQQIEKILADLIVDDEWIASKVVVVPAGTIEWRADYIYGKIVSGDN